VAHKLLVVGWHVLTRREANRHADAVRVACGFLNIAYDDIGARNLPGGQTAPEFVHRNPDRLGLGKDLQRIKRGSRENLVPLGTLPGAAPAPAPVIVEEAKDVRRLPRGACCPLYLAGGMALATICLSYFLAARGGVQCGQIPTGAPGSVTP
jgi:hypothetical protein